jgi:hypothetical protein
MFSVDDPGVTTNVLRVVVCHHRWRTKLMINYYSLSLSHGEKDRSENIVECSNDTGDRQTEFARSQGCLRGPRCAVRGDRYITRRAGQGSLHRAIPPAPLHHEHFGSAARRPVSTGSRRAEGPPPAPAGFYPPWASVITALPFRGFN